MTAKVLLGSAICCNVILCLALVGLTAGLTTWGLRKTKDDNDGGFDVSGYGLCQGKNITVAHSTLWSQYPATPVTIALNGSIPQEFEGKNSIVWSDTKGIEIFRVSSVRAQEGASTVIEADRNLGIDAGCHFTLDKLLVTERELNLYFKNPCEWPFNTEAWITMVSKRGDQLAGKCPCCGANGVRGRVDGEGTKS